MIEYTYQRVREILEQLAREFPNKIAPRFHIGEAYYGCRYLDPDGCPSCIVGVALDRLGIPREEIAFMDSEGDYTTPHAPSPVQKSNAEFWASFDVPGRILLAKAQYHQDRGRTWGDAVERALQDVPC